MEHYGEDGGTDAGKRCPRTPQPFPCQSAVSALVCGGLFQADMKRRVLYGMLVGGLAINLLVGALTYFSNVQAAEKDDALPNLRLFATVLDRVRQEYVAGDKLSYQ